MSASNRDKFVPPVSFPIKPPGPPKVWKLVDIKKRDADAPIRFSIQEVPEDRYEDVVEHMCTVFVADEPTCKSLNGKDDPVFVDSFRKVWREAVRQGLSVAAFTENPDGGKPILAGVNVLVLQFKGEKMDLTDIKPDTAKAIMKTFIDLSGKANVFEKYGVDRYVSAFGLSVHPSYRGASLGIHLLNARVDIGREYNLSVTSTAFTSMIAQKLAHRAGFETLVEKSYDELLDKTGKPLFPGIESKSMKVMARRLF